MRGFNFYHKNINNTDTGRAYARPASESNCYLLVTAAFAMAVAMTIAMCLTPAMAACPVTTAAGGTKIGTRLECMKFP